MERQQLLREVAYLRSQRLSIRAIAAKLGVNRGRVERALKAGAMRQQPQNRPAAPSSYSLATNIFVGYQRELEELKASLEDALRGRENLVMLVGEPGIGKTRMAQELASSATQRGAQVLWARYQENLGTPPYWPWAQAVRSYALAHQAEEIRSVMGKGIGYIAEIAAELREEAPELEPLPQLEPELSRLRLFEAVTTFFRNAAFIQPLVFIIDNLHWADRPSLLLLEFLVQELREAPILIVGTYRNEGLRDHPLPLTVGELTKEQRFRRIDLAGFTPEDVESLIKLFGFSNAPQALVNHIYQRTEGNPLFVTEVVRLLSQQGRLPQAPVSGHSSSPAAEHPPGDDWGFLLPDGVRDAIERRLSLLSDGCKEMLALASIIGREFGSDVLLPLTDEIPRDQLMDLLDEAVAARIVEEVPATVGHFRFTHVLIQETLSSRLSAARRALLHGRIGTTLEELLGVNAKDSAADLANHFGQAAPLLGNDKVAHYSLLAGDRALASFAWEDAILHFQRGLEAKAEEPMDADMASMLIGYGHARLATRTGSQPTDAVAELNRAFDYYVEIGDPDSAVVAAEIPMSTSSGSTPGAAQLVERALQLVPPDSLAACRLLLRYGWDLGRMRGDYKGALEAFQRALTIASEDGDVLLERQALAAAAEVEVFNLDCQESTAKSRRVIELAYQADDPWAEVSAHQRATLACTIIGDLEGARYHASAGMAPAERIRDYFWLTSSLWGKQFVHRMEGNWEAARETSDRLLSLAESPRNLSERVLLDYEQGDFEQGQAHLERLLRVHREMRAAPTSGHVMPALIIPLVNRIDPKAGHLEYAQSLAEAIVSSDSAPPLIASVARAGLALLAVIRRDETAAQDHYSALLALGGTMLHTGVIATDRVLGLLSETVGKPDQAERHFEDALRLCQNAGFLPEYCWCAYDLASSLLRTDKADKRDKATTLLDEALTVTSRLGMLPLAELILNLQASIASAPANYHRLTRRELDVLHLLAIGQSNREIARELVLSVRTVERHVTNIYAKIDARGRADATAYALRQGISDSP